MTAANPSAATRGFGATSRRDAWWIAPLLVGAGLTVFGVYSLVAAVEGSHYLYHGGGAHYLSPFYSPDLHSMFGVSPPFSVAFLVLWAPLGLRVTCYYYRKAYYRSFFLAPPGCAVSGPKRRRYRGESAFPFILQNLHRYFLYLATIVLGFLAYDAGRSFFFRHADGSLHFGIGLGSVVLTANVILLSFFTFGCNSLRHLIGGKLDCFTCSLRARTRHKLWRRVTWLNAGHMRWAWLSLASVGLADLYIRLASLGVFHDPRLF
ncbi:MAG TPA: hypothetical protein VF379_06040 [Gaiellaceae bacterium]